MKNLKKMAVALIILVCTASCKKEKVDPVLPPAPTATPIPVAPVTKNLVSINVPGRYEELYTYDNQGRVLVCNDVNDDKNTFTFNGNSFTMDGIRQNENNRTIATLTGTLDAAGRMATARGVTEYVQNFPIDVQWHFEYDADGYMTRATRTDSNGKVYVYQYSYTNGDLTRVEYFYNGALFYTEYFEYDLTKVNKLNCASHNCLGPTVTFIEGKTNAHMIKSGKLIRANGTTAWQFDSVFEFDTDGYPAKQISTGTTPQTVTYKYDK